jgi:tetratricopeptide (TPR) repeat protein
VEAALALRAGYEPGDLDAVEVRVQAALQSGNREVALRALATVPESSPLAENAHFWRGRILKELYRPAAAIAELRACLRLNPGRIEAHRELILIFGIERRAGDQEAQLWLLHDRAGGAIEALRILAQSTVIIPPGALAENADEGTVLRRCLETTPDDPWLPAPLAYFLRNRGRVDEARALLQPWLHSARTQPEIRVEDLACLLDDGDVEAAREWLERPVESLEEFGRYWLLRGDWLRMSDRSQDALESYREAVRREPRDPEIRYRLAGALRTAGLVREADAALDHHRKLVALSLLAARIAETAPDASLLAQAGQLCNELGRAREARAWYAAALRVDPAHAEARAFLARPEPPVGGPAEPISEVPNSLDPHR